MLLIDSMPSLAESPIDDRALLSRWRAAKDRDALGELLGRHGDDMWRLAFRICGNATDADDAVQTALMKAVHRAGRHEVESVRSWLLAIVTNASRDMLRRARTRARHERSAALDRPIATAADPDSWSHVRAALGRLPRSYAVPLLLAYVEGMRSESIAACLGISATAVRKRCERALSRLRADASLRTEALARQALAALPVCDPPAGMHERAVELARTGYGHVSLSAVITTTGLAAIVLALAIGVARVAWHPAVSKRTERAAMATEDAGPAAIPPMREDPDRAILDQRVHVRLRQPDLIEALTEIADVLPPGRTFEPPFYAFSTSAGMISRTYDASTVADIFNDLAGPGWRWQFAHGEVTFFRPLDAGAGRSHDLDDAAGRGLDSVSRLLLSWADDRAADDRALWRVFNDVTNFNVVTVPVAALEHDSAVCLAVKSRIAAILAAGRRPPTRAVAIAGFLRLTSLAPAFARLLTSDAVFDAEVEFAKGGAEQRERMFLRGALITALGRLGDEQSIDLLCRIAREDGRFHIASAYAFGGDRPFSPTVVKGDERSRNSAVGLFVDDRFAAIDGLRRIGGAHAAAALRSIVNDRGDYMPRGKAAMCLAKLGRVEALPDIRAALLRLRDGECHERWEQLSDPEAPSLCYALARLGEDAGVPELIDLLGTSPALRPAIIWAFLDVRDPRVAPALVELLQRDRDLADELDGKPGEKKAPPDLLLMRAAAAQDNAARVTLAALAHADDPPALEVPWRRDAFLILGYARDSEGVAALAAWGSDLTRSARDRCAIAQALGWSCLPEATAALEWMLAHHPEPDVRLAAVRALTILGQYLDRRAPTSPPATAPAAAERPIVPAPARRSF